MTRRNASQTGQDRSGASEGPVDVLAYCRVSTDEQGQSRLGLDAQRAAIEREAAHRNWRVVEWIEDTASGKSLDRPGIKRALELIEDSGPKVLVSAKLDRLSRSAIDFLTLIERAREQGWAIVLLEPNVDMTDPMGEFCAGIMAQVAQLERKMISARTKAALDQARARGKRIGRPLSLPAHVVHRIVDMRERGASLATIAAELNADGVPTARGGKQWYASTVRAALRARGGE